MDDRFIVVGHIERPTTHLAYEDSGRPVCGNVKQSFLLPVGGTEADCKMCNLLKNKHERLRSMEVVEYDPYRMEEIA